MTFYKLLFLNRSPSLTVTEVPEPNQEDIFANDDKNLTGLVGWSSTWIDMVRDEILFANYGCH